MMLPATAPTRTSVLMAKTLAAALLAAPHGHHSMLHLLLSFGLVGIFFVSIVDSSFVPLPVPGITDIMVVVLAAQHANLILLLALTTTGSALGGLFSHKVGQAGGMALLEKHVKPSILNPVCNWMNKHAILSVALPAVLPPPMPLSPFVLAAGALNMRRRTFMISFTVSRFLRHAAAAAIGVYFGPHVIRIWNMFSRKWAVPILIAIWSIILISAGFAIWKLYKASRDTRNRKDTGAPSRAQARA